MGNTTVAPHWYRIAIPRWGKEEKSVAMIHINFLNGPRGRYRSFRETYLDRRNERGAFTGYPATRSGWIGSAQKKSTCRPHASIRCSHHCGDGGGCKRRQNPHRFLVRGKYATTIALHLSTTRSRQVRKRVFLEHTIPYLRDLLVMPRRATRRDG